MAAGIGVSTEGWSLSHKRGGNVSQAQMLNSSKAWRVPGQQEGVAVPWGCWDKAPQTGGRSPSVWKPQVQDQGASRAGAAWGLGRRTRSTAPSQVLWPLEVL